MTGITTENLVIDGLCGEIPVRVYRPGSNSADIGLVWAHGGSFIGGDLDMPEADWVATELAGRGVTVASVDYRLAPVPESYLDLLGHRPGYPYPAPSEDVSTAFDWAVTSGVGSTDCRWSLGGASAGGNLAAGAALRLRDAGGASPNSLVLAYPLVHFVVPAPRPALTTDLALLKPDERFTVAEIEEININYLGGLPEPDAPYAFPGGKDLAGLPPSLVVVSQFDDLRPSGEVFAAELAMSGVDVSLVSEAGARHGHLNRPAEVQAQRSINRIRTWLDWVDSSPVARHHCSDER